jgi:protocatechuate 3,4-dioxygenase beta subunit
MSGRSSPWRLSLIAALIGGLGGSTVLALGGSAAAAGPTTTAAPACPAYNPPNTMTLVAGTPQSAQLGTPYATDLQVSISNSNGCPVTTGPAGIPVTFTAPSSGPSGTFASSGSNAVLVGTSASGIASAPEFTANRLAGGFTAVATSDYGTVGFSLVNTASGVPVTIAAVTANQSATVGSRYPLPLQATVLDANGNPVVGATVTFTLGAGTGGGGAGPGTTASAGASFAGGSNPAVETTDSSGTATSPSFTADSTAGRFTATASTAGIVEPAAFSLHNLAAKSPTIVAVGKQRTATVGAGYAKPLQVKVRNGSGAPLPGAAVTFTLGASGAAGGGPGSAGAPGASFVGGATQAAATTNANGLATSPLLIANTTAGTFAATATMSGANEAATFEFRNRAGKPATIMAGAGASESTVVGTRFPIRLAVTVSDKDGNPVAGVIVTFRAPSGGASGRFDGTKRTVEVKTDAKGIAVAPRFVANKTQGGYVVRAGAAGHATAFALVNQPAS